MLAEKEQAAAALDAFAPLTGASIETGSAVPLKANQAKSDQKFPYYFHENH